MTDWELQGVMRRILLESLRTEIEQGLYDGELFEASRGHQRQMKAMLKDPLKWMKNKTKPFWKFVIQKIAVVLLVVSVSVGGLMAVSAPVRAAVIRWATEWYETHIAYRFSGEAHIGDMPDYEISELPESFKETDRYADSASVSVFYEDGQGGVVCFDYVFIQSGVGQIITGSKNIVEVTVDGSLGYLVLPTDNKDTTTITWIDQDANISFFIDTTLDEETAMKLAESVCLKFI